MAVLRLTTYNSTGLSGERKAYIRKLFKNTDILLLQEHWLHKLNLTELNDLHTDWFSVSCSGMPPNRLHKKGRPYGGSAILYNSSVSHDIVHIPCKYKNICAIIMKETLIVNAYMPKNNYSVTNVTPDYSTAVDHIDGLIASNRHQSLVIGGDMSIDLSKNHAHTKHLTQFAERHRLFFVASHQLATYSSTFKQYLVDGSIRSSAVDHFLVSEDIYDAIVDVSCIEERVDNPSWHSPLRFIVSFPDSQPDD